MGNLKAGSNPGSTFAYPIRTQARRQGRVYPIEGMAYRANFRARAEEYNDFVGSGAIEDPFAGFTIAAGGSPTAAKLATQVADGNARCLLASTNEAESAGISFNDKVQIPGNAQWYFECLAKIDTVPTSVQEVAIGMASAYNATLDSVADNYWFRLSGNGTLTVEADNATTDVDDRATTRITSIAANTFYLFRVDGTDPGRVRYYVNDVRVSEVVITPRSALLQPLAVIKKASGTGVPALFVDYIYVAWNRSNFGS